MEIYFLKGYKTRKNSWHILNTKVKVSKSVLQISNLQFQFKNYNFPALFFDFDFLIDIVF
jgi:hypothetical protein